MPRWTTNSSEVFHQATILDSLPTGIGHFTMRNGQTFDAHVAGFQSGNNAGQVLGASHPTSWQCYGDVTVTLLDGTKHVLDVQDIASVSDAWDRCKDAFVNAGIIRIVEFPNAG